MAVDVREVEECDYFLLSKHDHVRITVERDRQLVKLCDLQLTLLMPDYFLMRTPRN